MGTVNVYNKTKIDDMVNDMVILGYDVLNRLTLEQVQDAVAAMIIPGANVTKTYDDAAGTLTLSVSSGANGGYNSVYALVYQD